MQHLQKTCLLVLSILLINYSQLNAQLSTCEELFNDYNTLNATCISSLSLDEKITYLNQLLTIVATGAIGLSTKKISDSLR